MCTKCSNCDETLRQISKFPLKFLVQGKVFLFLCVRPTQSLHSTGFPLGPRVFGLVSNIQITILRVFAKGYETLSLNQDVKLVAKETGASNSRHLT